MRAPAAIRLASRIVAVLALLAATVALSACGGAEAVGGERPYVDARGQEVMIPRAPQRIIALSEPTLDGLLALGITPIATTAGRGQGGVASYLGARAAGVPSIGILGQPKIERVAELAPDLILTDGTSIQDGAIRDKLAMIAPTVDVSKTGEDWRTAFTALADITGHRAEGKRLLASFDQRVADVRGRLGANADAQISIVRWGGIGLPAVILKELPASRTVADLGLERPPAQDREGDGHSEPISLEHIDRLDGDWMFFGSLGNGGAAGGVSDTPADLEAARQAIEWARETPGFSRLKAEREGHVVPVDGSAWTSAGGYLAQQTVLDDLERTLAEPAK